MSRLLLSKQQTSVGPKTHWRTACLGVVLLTFVWAMPAMSLAVDVKKSLHSMPRNSWYDKQTGDYIPPEIEPPLDNPLRSQGWLAPEKAESENVWKWDWWRLPNWNLGAWLSQWFSRLVVVVLGLVLLGVIVLLTYFSLRNYMPSRFERSMKYKSLSIDPLRVVDLPFEVKRSEENLLGETERLMQAGKFDEAIVYLYAYLLLALDQSRIIHLQRGKTNRMYLRELQQLDRLRALTESAMFAFEDVFFGKHSLSRERFLELWHHVDEFHHDLASRAALADPLAVSEAATT